MNIFKIARKISRALTLPYKLFVKYVLTPVLSCLYRNVTFSEKKKKTAGMDTITMVTLLIIIYDNCSHLASKMI